MWVEPTLDPATVIRTYVQMLKRALGEAYPVDETPRFTSLLRALDLSSPEPACDDGAGTASISARGVPSRTAVIGRPALR